MRRLHLYSSYNFHATPKFKNRKTYSLMSEQFEIGCIYILVQRCTEFKHLMCDPAITVINKCLISLQPQFCLTKLNILLSIDDTIHYLFRFRFETTS